MKLEKFMKDVERHEMQVLNDTGLYRHLRFSRPGSSCMQFHLVTYPGYLVFSGDMGCYVFSRLQDMFEFFRTDRGRGEGINPGYWAEKVQAEDRHDRVRVPSRDAYIAAIRRDVNSWMEGAPISLSEKKDLWQSVKDDVLGVLEYHDPHEWDRAVHDFEWGSFRFTDFWDRSLTEWTYRYLWCCRAIAWAIKAYDETRAAK